MSASPPPIDQSALEALGRQVAFDGLTRMAEYVANPDADIEVVTKIVNSKALDVGKAVPEKKQDPYGNVPVVHITIGRGIKATLVDPLPVSEIIDIVESVSEPAVLPEPEPLPPLPTLAELVPQPARPAETARVPLNEAFSEPEYDPLELLP